MRCVSAWLAAIWVANAHAQYLYSLGGQIGSNSITSICNETFNDANSTGYFEIQPHVAQLPQQNQPDNNSGYTLPVEIGVTVTEHSGSLSGTVEWSMWLSTSGANYSDDGGLGYDVCMFTVAPISTNTILRGQTDSGNCLATFDADCKTALQDAASSYALGLIDNATPPPNSNLTENSLANVCYKVAQSLEDNFPKQCQEYMNSTDITIGSYPLTNYEHTGLYDGCTLTNSNTGNLFHFLYTASGQTQDDPTTAKQLYTGFNWEVLPVMLTFMPIANVNRGQSIADASSRIACVHATNINPGSEKLVTPPSPTPVGSKGLSGGAIAGIVVGVVLGVAVIAGAAFWFWRKRRVSRKQKATDAAAEDHPPAYMDAEEHKSPMAEAPVGTGANELSQENELRPELPTHRSGPRVELAADAKPTQQKFGNAQPAELLAEVPNSAVSDGASHYGPR